MKQNCLLGLLATAVVTLAAPCVASAALPDPIHHFPFDEPAGSKIAVDAKGGKTLREGNNATYSIDFGVPGKAGTAIHMPASPNQEFLRMSPSAVTRAGAWTVALWVMPKADGTVTTRGFRRLFQPSNTANYRLQLETRLKNPLRPTGLPGIFTSGPPLDIAAFTGASPLPKDQWTHVAFVSTGTELRLYIGGARSGSALAKSVALDIDTVKTFNVSLDDLRIYDVALTDAQVKELVGSYDDTEKWLVLIQGAREILHKGTLDLNPGTVGVGKTQTFTLTLENRGLLDIAFKGSPRVRCTDCTKGEFSVSRQPASTILQPGKNTLFDVQFTPKDDGSETRTLVIESDIPKLPTVEYKIRARGQFQDTNQWLKLTIDGKTAITGGSIAMSGTTAVGGSRQVTATLTNAGPVAIKLTGSPRIRCDCASGDFSATDIGLSALSPGQSVTFTLTFTPKAAGTRFGNMLVQTDIPGHSTVRYTVSGQADDPRLTKQTILVPGNGPTYELMVEYWLVEGNQTPLANATVIPPTPPRYVPDDDKTITFGNRNQTLVMRITNINSRIPILSPWAWALDDKICQFKQIFATRGVTVVWEAGQQYLMAVQNTGGSIQRQLRPAFGGHCSGGSTHPLSFQIGSSRNPPASPHTRRVLDIIIP